jgi:hypothetical protein
VHTIRKTYLHRVMGYNILTGFMHTRRLWVCPVADHWRGGYVSVDSDTIPVVISDHPAQQRYEIYS